MSKDAEQTHGGSGAFAQTDTGASPTVLLYLFADRLLLGADHRKGAPVPGREAHVPTVNLTRMLLASAFWSLREQSVVRLDLVQTTRLLFLKGQEVRVTPVREAPPLRGVEGSLAVLLGGPRPESVNGLVRRWFGRNRANAQGHVIHQVVREAAANGLIDSDEMGSVGLGFAKLKGLGLGPKGQVDQTKVAALEPAFADAQSRWATFARNEPELYGALLGECERAIESRQSQSD
jgi:hypothetical protein